MAKTSAKARAFISRHIRKHKRKYHMDQRQALAVALSEARAKGFKIPRRNNNGS